MQHIIKSHKNLYKLLFLSPMLGSQTQWQLVLPSSSTEQIQIHHSLRFHHLGLESSTVQPCGWLTVLQPFFLRHWIGVLVSELALVKMIKMVMMLVTSPWFGMVVPGGGHGKGRKDAMALLLEYVLWNVCIVWKEVKSKGMVFCVCEMWMYMRCLELWSYVNFWFFLNCSDVWSLKFVIYLCLLKFIFEFSTSLDVPWKEREKF